MCFVSAYGEHSLYPQGNCMMVEITSTVGSSLSKGAFNLTVTEATFLQRGLVKDQIAMGYWSPNTL